MARLALWRRAASKAAVDIEPDVAGASISPRDLLSEALFAIGARPGRLVLTVLGTVLGVASLIVTVGLAQTMAAQVNKRFDAIVATQVVVQAPAVTGPQAEDGDHSVLPWDAEARMRLLHGVIAAGAFGTLNLGSTPVAAILVNDPSAATDVPVEVLATSPGALDAVRGRIVTGRYFDAGHDARADRVAVLGKEAADRLGVGHVEAQPAIFIGETPYTVIGIIDSPKRRADMLGSVMIPLGTARTEFGLAAPDEVQAHVRLGAGQQVGRQAPLQLDPVNPTGLEVQAPMQGSSVKSAVIGDVNAVFIALGAVALIVGGIGIANITLLSVMERIGEIGLRRALGASKKAVAGQFMAESAMIGLLGGLIGAALAVAAIVVVCLTRHWTPVLDTALVAGATLLGAVIGWAAGIYPAIRAAATEPVTALHSGV